MSRSLSLARRLRLAREKAEARQAVLRVECAICGWQATAKTRPMLQAHLTTHYTAVHPEIVRSGGLGILGTTERKVSR